MRSGVGVTDKGQADREVMRVVKGMSSISQLVEGGREMEADPIPAVGLGNWRG